jgi:hypothetical protein
MESDAGPWWPVEDGVYLLPIKIKVHTDSYLGNVKLGQIIEVIHGSASELDEEIVRRFAVDSLFEESDAKDLARSGLTLLRSPHFAVVRIDRGSIIISGFAAFVAGWILKTFLGAPLKEAWKKSEARKRLVDAMKRKIDTIAERLAERLGGEDRWRSTGLELESARKKLNGTTSIEIVLRKRQRRRKRIEQN